MWRSSFLWGHFRGMCMRVREWEREREREKSETGRNADTENQRDIDRDGERQRYTKSERDRRRGRWRDRDRSWETKPNENSKYSRRQSLIWTLYTSSTPDPSSIRDAMLNRTPWLFIVWRQLARRRCAPSRVSPHTKRQIYVLTTTERARRREREVLKQSLSSFKGLRKIVQNEDKIILLLAHEVVDAGRGQSLITAPVSQVSKLHDWMMVFIR